MRRRISTTELLAGWLLLSITLPSPAALAAPFCLQTEAVPPQCIFYDTNACRKEATRQNGICVSNPGQVSLPRGTGKYCLVISNHSGVCDYNDLSSCEKQAARQQAGCVEAPAPGAPNFPDPYRYLRILQPG